MASGSPWLWHLARWRWHLGPSALARGPFALAPYPAALALSPSALALSPSTLALCPLHWLFALLALGSWTVDDFRGLIPARRTLSNRVTTTIDPLLGLFLRSGGEKIFLAEESLDPATQFRRPKKIVL